MSLAVTGSRFSKSPHPHPVFPAGLFLTKIWNELWVGSPDKNPAQGQREAKPTEKCRKAALRQLCGCLNRGGNTTIPLPHVTESFPPSHALHQPCRWETHAPAAASQPRHPHTAQGRTHRSGGYRWINKFQPRLEQVYVMPVFLLLSVLFRARSAASPSCGPASTLPCVNSGSSAAAKSRT